MNLDPREQKTIDFYDKRASEWSNARGGVKRSSVLLLAAKRLCTLLPKGKVLEIGCGSGEDATILIKMGYEYVGTDISSGLVALAQRNNPGIVFPQMSVYQLDFPDNTFDGFWSAATLLHIPKEKIDTGLRELRRVLKNGAIGFITVKEGEGEKVDPDTGRFFSYYSKEEFENILIRNGYAVIEAMIDNGPRDKWLRFYVKVVN